MYRNDKLSSFDRMFDLNRDGKLDSWERTVQYQYLNDMTEKDYVGDIFDDEDDYDEDDYDEDDDDDYDEDDDDDYDEDDDDDFGEDDEDDFGDDDYDDYDDF